MKQLYISKSKYCGAVQCPKMLWMHKNMKNMFDDSVMNLAVLEQGNEVGDIAMGLFGDFIEIAHGDLQQMMDDTSDLLKKETPIIAEASFSYNGLFCSVDILKANNNSYELYEVKSSTAIKEIYYHDLAFQYYVLTKLGFKVSKVYIVYINNNYIRHGELELSNLFTIEDVTQPAVEMFDDVGEYISMLSKYMEQKEEPFMDISETCFNPYTCGYWVYCSRHIPSPSIFDIAKLRTKIKFDCYRHGIIEYKDILKSVSLDEKQEHQVRAYLYNTPPIVNKKGIKDFIDTLTYPLYFLDFETFQQAIPRFDDMSPYMQIPFQYSLHSIYEEGDALEHKEFLACLLYTSPSPRD